MDNSSLILGALLIVVLYMICSNSSRQQRRPALMPSIDGNLESTRQKLDNYSFAVSGSPAGDYSDVVMQMALEPSVLKSHQQFITDTSANTSGASPMSVRDDDNNLVPWVGIRRPEFNVYVDPNARTVPTEMPYQMPDNSRYYKGAGSLF
jgi:hypothetical protein